MDKMLGQRLTDEDRAALYAYTVEALEKFMYEGVIEVSPREFMQVFGTEGGQRLRKTLWVDIASPLWNALPGIVLVPDTRFVHELAVLDDLILVMRPGTFPVNGHISEQLALKLMDGVDPATIVPGLCFYRLYNNCPQPLNGPIHHPESCRVLRSKSSDPKCATCASRSSDSIRILHTLSDIRHQVTRDPVHPFTVVLVSALYSDSKGTFLETSLIDSRRHEGRDALEAAVAAEARAHRERIEARMKEAPPQRALEREIIKESRERAVRLMEKREKDGQADMNPYARPIYRRYLLPLRDMIAETIQGLGKAGRRKAHVALLKPLDPASMAFIAVRTVLCRMRGRRSPDARECAREIGVDLYRELVLATVENLNPEGYWKICHDIDRRNSKDKRYKYRVIRDNANQHDIELPDWGPSEREQVGMWLIEALRTLGMVEVERRVIHLLKGRREYFDMAL
ncbi:hypothetical protein DFQ30_010805, partial [Apophysomyces sp. BC1015]